jgi:LysR family D-serine deaminase transcriptional activator
VSHRINQLEEELGIQLFVRSHRKVELTREGKRVYWALKSSLDGLNQEILDIKNQELSGTSDGLLAPSSPSAGWCRRWGIYPPLSVDLAYRADRQR